MVGNPQMKTLEQLKGDFESSHPGITLIAAAAKAVHNPPNQFGICLRGLPGWGEQLAPLDTVINTYGGRWFDQTWIAQLDSPESSSAIKFYIARSRPTASQAPRKPASPSARP